MNLRVDGSATKTRTRWLQARAGSTISWVAPAATRFTEGGSDSSLWKLQDALPDIDGRAIEYVVNITKDDDKVVIADHRVRNSMPGRVSALNRGNLCYGRFDVTRIEENGRHILNVLHPPQKNDSGLSRHASRVIEVLREMSRWFPMTTPATLIDVREGKNGLAARLARSRGPVIMLEGSYAASDWREIGRSLHRAISHPSYDYAAIQEHNLETLMHGVEVLWAERFATAVLHKERNRKALITGWDRERWSNYIEGVPHRSSMFEEATEGTGVERKTYRSFVCPLVLKLLLSGSIDDLDGQEYPVGIEVSDEDIASVTAFLADPSPLPTFFQSRDPVLAARVQRMEQENLNLYIGDNHLVDHHYEDLRASRADFDAPRSCPPDSVEIDLLVSGLTAGFLENCGCEINQAGGAAKRHQFIRDVRDASTIVIDLGWRYSSADVQSKKSRLEHGLIRELFDDEIYDVTVPAIQDLAVERAYGSMDNTTTANIRRRTDGELVHPPYRIVAAGGLRVAVIGMTGVPIKSSGFYSPPVQAWRDSFTREDPVATVRELLREQRDLDSADLLILAGTIPEPIVADLAREFPEIDVIVTSVGKCGDKRSGSDNVFRINRGPFRYREVLVYPYSIQEFGIGRIRVRMNKETKRASHAAYTAVFLKDEYTEDEAIRAKITKFYKSVAPQSEWRLPPLFPGNGATGGGYVGSDRCGTCHQEIYAGWKARPHGHAYDTLLAAKRHYVPGCVQCHVVGLGEESGFESVWKGGTGSGSALTGVGCEVCHGGGAAHSSAPTKDNIKRHVDAKTCAKCHDKKHSSKFAESVRSYFEKIRHW